MSIAACSERSAGPISWALSHEPAPLLGHVGVRMRGRGRRLTVATRRIQLTVTERDLPFFPAPPPTDGRPVRRVVVTAP